MNEPTQDGEALTALRELVACKDLKIEWERLALKIADGDDDPEVFRQWDAIKGDYDHRAPLAWEAARAALRAEGASQPKGGESKPEPAAYQVLLKMLGASNWIDCPSKDEYEQALASGQYRGRVLYYHPPAPEGAEPPATNDWKLPHDFIAAGATFRAGVSAKTLALRVENLWEAAFGPMPTKAEQEANFARLTGAEPPEGNWIAAEDHYRNVRALDVALNGEDGAAARPLLIDVLSQVQAEVRKRGAPLLAAPPVLVVPAPNHMREAIAADIAASKDGVPITVARRMVDRVWAVLARAALAGTPTPTPPAVLSDELLLSLAYAHSEADTEASALRAMREVLAFHQTARAGATPEAAGEE